MGKTSSDVKNRWNAQNYDRITALVPKGMREVFKAACAARGDTMNAVLVAAINAYMEKTQDSSPE